MAMVWFPQRWAPVLMAILALVAPPTAVAAGVPDHQGIACPTRPAVPTQTTMNPNHPHPAQAIPPAAAGRAPRTAVATFALG